MTKAEQELSSVMSEFARTMLTDFPIQGILDHLVSRIVDVLPITAAGVTLIAPGSDPRYIAASNGSSWARTPFTVTVAAGSLTVPSTFTVVAPT